VNLASAVLPVGLQSCSRLLHNDGVHRTTASYCSIQQLLNGAVACSGPVHTVMLLHTAVLSSGVHMGGD
jgi:hypothetical protein